MFLVFFFYIYFFKDFKKTVGTLLTFSNICQPPNPIFHSTAAE